MIREAAVTFLLYARGFGSARTNIARDADVP